MDVKGTLVLLTRNLAEAEPFAVQLRDLGFLVEVTNFPNFLLDPKNRGRFDHALLSMDAIDTQFLNLLSKIESFLNCPCTLFCEDPTASTNRLLRINHPWKLFGKADPKIFEQVFFQAKVHNLKYGKIILIQTGRLQREVAAPGLTSLTEHYGPSVVGETDPEAWRICTYLTVLPITKDSESGYLIVGFNQENGDDAGQKIIDAWVKNLGEGKVTTLFNPIKFSSENEKCPISNSPFFAVKTALGRTCGLGFVPHNLSLPNLLRNEKGYSAYEAKCLAAGTTVPFDLSIHLPQNNRFVKMVKSGSEITNDKLKQIAEIGKGEFHLLEEQRHNFENYYNMQQLKIFFSQIKNSTAPLKSVGTK